MAIITKGRIEKSEDNKKWYDRKGYHMTGETLIFDYGNEACEYVVFKGDWTRSGTIRDCGSYYIYAGYSRYDRIDKETLEITKDVDDK